MRGAAGAYRKAHARTQTVDFVQVAIFPPGKLVHFRPTFGFCWGTIVPHFAGMIFSWHAVCIYNFPLLVGLHNMDDTTLMDSIDIDSIGTEPVQGRKLAASGKRTLGGRPAFDSKKQAVFAAQPIEKKAEVLKRQ